MSIEDEDIRNFLCILKHLEGMLKMDEVSKAHDKQEQDNK
jgi:hypothetical protein